MSELSDAELKARLEERRKKQAQLGPYKSVSFDDLDRLPITQQSREITEPALKHLMKLQQQVAQEMRKYEAERHPMALVMDLPQPQTVEMVWSEVELFCCNWLKKENGGFGLPRQHGDLKASFVRTPLKRANRLRRAVKHVFHFTMDQLERQAHVLHVGNVPPLTEDAVKACEALRAKCDEIDWERAYCTLLGVVRLPLLDVVRERRIRDAVKERRDAYMAKHGLKEGDEELPTSDMFMTAEEEAVWMAIQQRHIETFTLVESRTFWDEFMPTAFDMRRLAAIYDDYKGDEPLPAFEVRIPFAAMRHGFERDFWIKRLVVQGALATLWRYASEACTQHWGVKEVAPGKCPPLDDYTLETFVEFHKDDSKAPPMATATDDERRDWVRNYCYWSIIVRLHPGSHHIVGRRPRYLATEARRPAMYTVRSQMVASTEVSLAAEAEAEVEVKQEQETPSAADETTEEASSQPASQ